MDQVSIYIKKLIALALSSAVAYFLSFYIPVYLFIPFGFLLLSFLHYKITEVKPDHLFGLKKTNAFLDEKGGFWILFKWIFSLLGMIYDLLVWIIYGIYVLFIIFSDIIILIKTILFWIVHAVLWILKLFIPPILFMYRFFVYYFILWPWWIYRVSVRNIGYSYNRNMYLISLWGAVLFLFTGLLFTGIGLLVDIPALLMVGIVFGLIPVVWSYGEISSLRQKDNLNEPYSSVRHQFQNGFDTVRSVLFYLLIFLIAFVAEILLNLTGWIPGVGFSFLGLTFNISTFFSLVLLVVFVILLFAKFLLPTHLIYHQDYEMNLSSTFRLLGTIGRKFIRYVIVHIPASFFSFLVALLPGVVVILAVMLSITIKNSVLDSRINMLEVKSATQEGTERYITSQRAEQLRYYHSFPQNIFDDFINLKELVKEREALKNTIAESEREYNRNQQQYQNEVDSLKENIESYRSRGDTLSMLIAESMEQETQKLERRIMAWRVDKFRQIEALRYDLKQIRGMIVQLPLVFFFTIIWIALFGGLVLAVIVAYLGNIYYELYSLKEDGRPVYFRQLSEEFRKKDRKQPLLGFTLLVIIGIAVYLVVSGMISFPIDP